MADSASDTEYFSAAEYLSEGVHSSVEQRNNGPQNSPSREDDLLRMTATPRSSRAREEIVEHAVCNSSEGQGSDEQSYVTGSDIERSNGADEDSEVRLNEARIQDRSVGPDGIIIQHESSDFNGHQITQEDRSTRGADLETPTSAESNQAQLTSSSSSDLISPPRLQQSLRDTVHIRSFWEQGTHILSNYSIGFWVSPVILDGRATTREFLTHEHGYQHRKFLFLMRIYRRRSAATRALDVPASQQYQETSDAFETHAAGCTRLKKTWGGPIKLKKFAVDETANVPRQIMRAWVARKYQESKDVMRHKLFENSARGARTRECLLATGNALIVKHIVNPACHVTWGCDKHGNGQNWWGKILMELRDELRERLGLVPLGPPHLAHGVLVFEDYEGPGAL